MDGGQYGSCRTSIYANMEAANGNVTHYIPQQVDFYKKTPFDPMPGGHAHTAWKTLDDANQIDNESYIWAPQNRGGIRMNNPPKVEPSWSQNKIDPLFNSSQKIPDKLLLPAGSTFRRPYVNQGLS